MFDNGSTLSELIVFEENYALLHNTIADINIPLMKHFLKEKIITAEEEKQIAAITVSLKKLLHLLQIVSSSLKADNTRSFYIMVKIMKTHGDKGTQTLADHIMNKLNISADKLSHICSDEFLMQNDPKGLFVLKYCVVYN